MIDSLINNPLAQWGLGQTRRDKRSIVIMIVFLALFYGLAGLIFMSWMSRSWRNDLEDLCNVWASLAAIVVGVMLLLWAPARVATAIAKQREEGVLDMLRLTGMSGSDLAVGHLLTQMSLPLTLAALTSPLIISGVFSEAGPVGTLRLTIVMILLTPVYCMFGALAGLTVKKPATAGGAGMFAAIALLISSGVAISMGMQVRESRILSFLGPWGQTMAWDHESNFEVQVLGVGVPGDLLQIAFLVILSSALLRGLAFRYTSRDAVFFGRRGALLLLFGICALCLASWYPDPFPVQSHRWRSRNFMDQPASLAFHLIVPFVALLWAALETPLSAQSFVRGKARRDADDAILTEEKFALRRFAAPALVFGLMTVLFLIPFGIGNAEFATRPGGTWEVDGAGLLLGGAIAIAAYCLLSLTVQWAVLATRDIGVPRLLATMAVFAFWTLPVIAGAVLSSKSAPDEVTLLAFGINPFFGITAAAHSGSPTPVAGFEPSAVALYCLAVQSFAALGVFMSLRTQRERLEDHANSLVTLPADAYAAPGTLTQQCERGHLYTDAWVSCPHCEPSAKRIGRTEGKPPDPSQPPGSAPPPTTAAQDEDLLDLDAIAARESGDRGSDAPTVPAPVAPPDPLAAAIQRSSLGAKADDENEDDDLITPSSDEA
ncbi:MAG: hypothetical protein JKY65_18515 [Planctomycetes bacterium]|nr:hypothetical protein [Planctomycetota bacterium]